MSDVIAGPLWAARNWSATAGAGSIHDDATAAELGFRGGTVAADVHMNQFPPVLLKLFGQDWFRNGNLSIQFHNATVDRERVQVFAQPLSVGASQTKVWMERDDGLLVCSGSAAVGDHSGSALRTKDLRPCAPGELRIFNRLHQGLSLGDYDVLATPDKQFQRYDDGLISDPLNWFKDGSPWNDPVAAPCTVLEYLWAYPMQQLATLIGDAVGLFGAIEIGFKNGPLLLNQHYHLHSEVICVGQSPQTEYVWYETVATATDGLEVARLLIQSRAMKASSVAYATDQ